MIGVAAMGGALMSNYQQLVVRGKSAVPAGTAAPATKPQISGRIWMNTCME